MRIAIGPLPSSWVRAWAIDASESMRQASSRSAELPFAVGDDFFARNRAVARQWMELASRSEVFVWEGEGDPDVLLTVMQYWRNLAEVRRDLMATGAAPAMHPDAERFSQAMRRATLDALVTAGRMTPAYADRLEASWPVLSVPPAPSAAGDGDVAQHERHARGAAR